MKWGGWLFVLAVSIFGIFVYRAYRRRRARQKGNVDAGPSSYHIKYLTAVGNGADGSITVTWSLSPPDPLKTYRISYRKLGQWTSRSSSSAKIRLTREHHHIEPLNIYEIKVWPDGFETAASSVRVYVDWYCHLPGCQRSRRKRNSSYSAFCSSDHAAGFGRKYCLFPECTERASRHHFCSNNHLEKAKTEGVCGLVNLDRASKQFEKLKKEFSKTWCSEKGQLPKISHILEIVNPKLEHRLDKYVSNLSWPYNGVEQYYHGTQIKCEMLEYYEACSLSSCGVCGISREGFDPGRISNRSWQRFGKGFYFAFNSSKSYDYPRATHDSSSAGSSKYRCMLVCDIAPGCKHKLYRNDPSIERPPPGYNSVYGKSTWMWIWKSPDLNYDELVVFDAEAIRPHYILFLEDTS